MPSRIAWGIGIHFSGNYAMARADLLVSLVKANSQGDSSLFRRTLEALIAEERGKQHHFLADQLAQYLNGNGISYQRRLDPGATADERVRELFHEVNPRRRLTDLVLPLAVGKAVEELAEEQMRRDLLRAHGLEPRHRLLLIGPPGNGKTSLAEALAEALLLPLFVVRYEGVIGSYLGETAARLRRLFDFVRTRSCVLFLDEFDTLGKERGDEHETGEVKRVVSSLLLQIDDLPSHVVVVTATNHPELLDRAVWRRFQLRLKLPAPTEHQVTAWITGLAARLGEPLGLPASKITPQLKGLSFAELEEFTTDLQRRRVLAAPGTELKPILVERLRQWKARQGAASGGRGQDA